MRSLYEPAVSILPSPMLHNETVAPRIPEGCETGTTKRFGDQTPSMNRSIDEVLAPMLALTRGAQSPLSYSPVGEFHHGTCLYRLPRFVFRGAPGGAETIRLGLFAAIHGDEPEGTFALLDLLRRLMDSPALVEGYELYVYPVCNPTGFEDGTRHSRVGRDLNREFWKGSTQPEVYFLERELGVLQFAGLIALHSDDTTEGTYAYVRGATLTEALAKPALLAAARFLAPATGEIIDGFPANNGLISQCYEGVLSNPAELNPAPFEIIFETPQRAPVELQVQAAVAAMEAVLREYRQFLAYAQDL